MPQTISIDFSQIPSMEPLPKGNYPVVVDSVVLTESKSSENPYFNWTLTVTEPGECQNRKLFFMTSLAEKSLWRLMAIFTNLGVYEEKIQIQVDDQTNMVIYPELSGLTGVAVVTQEVYEKRLQNRVEDILAPSNLEVAVPVVAWKSVV